jgi:hypothetical protein
MLPLLTIALWYLLVGTRVLHPTTSLLLGTVFMLHNLLRCCCRCCCAHAVGSV